MTSASTDRGVRCSNASSRRSKRRRAVRSPSTSPSRTPIRSSSGATATSTSRSTTARTLDTMGVTTFDVLSLPFLVQDDDQADRVATSDAADLMMAGLSAIDATGLVLAPVYQNHFAIAGDEPLRTLDQLHTGIRVNPLSNRVDQLFEAIGGHAAHDLNGDDWYNAIVSGEALAMEWPTTPRGGHAGADVDGHELHDLLRVRCRDDPRRLARRAQSRAGRRAAGGRGRHRAASDRRAPSRGGRLRPGLLGGRHADRRALQLDGRGRRRGR